MRLFGDRALRLPSRAHTSQPWRIHEIAYDFRLEDVWALPTRGGAGDFPRLVEVASDFDPMRSSDRVVRTLFEVRLQLGKWLRWDEPSAGIDSRVPTLRDRLPAELLGSVSDADLQAASFAPLYRLDDEFAAEIANRTMHGVLHLGWVLENDGSYRGQLAILVKPNGLPGNAYLAAIKPFRYWIVYPQMLEEFKRAWEKTLADRAE
ncbi:MAG: DUF2867 domain-containing protein [Actinomycetota bacterium]